MNLLQKVANAYFPNVLVNVVVFPRSQFRLWLGYLMMVEHTHTSPARDEIIPDRTPSNHGSECATFRGGASCRPIQRPLGCHLVSTQGISVGLASTSGEHFSRRTICLEVDIWACRVSGMVVQQVIVNFIRTSPQA